MNIAKEDAYQRRVKKSTQPFGRIAQFALGVHFLSDIDGHIHDGDQISVLVQQRGNVPFHQDVAPVFGQVFVDRHLGLVLVDDFTDHLFHQRSSIHGNDGLVLTFFQHLRTRKTEDLFRPRIPVDTFHLPICEDKTHRQILKLQAQAFQ